MAAASFRALMSKNPAMSEALLINGMDADAHSKE